ncbi:hypothetical protein G4G28_07300 [Massilia sp. Dwa41.01b]|uniref:hypothetical protein n=1 Tax=Massilia sp. Dwa41.01b TaxID=2709302 RepID=UPI0016020D6E|nr:hypothetical protein [Massilia sp. Dwa41.01b]QNA88356.1 hypothetical protein G4G28_07300 [Massilia sp. Dwa41.01b]
MIKRLPLALALPLLLASAAGHAAEPLFLENGATRSVTGQAAAANSPFGKDNKVGRARLGLHVNPAALGAAELSMPLPDGRQFTARRAQRYDARRRGRLGGQAQCRGTRHARSGSGRNHPGRA